MAAAGPDQAYGAAGGAVDKNCLFCRIVAGTIPANLVRETDRTVAFRDISPQAPVHVLVIPRVHVPDVGALVSADAELAGLLIRECAAVAADEGVSDSGYRVVFNTGDQGGQAVHHCHAHVLGGRQLGAQLG